MSCCKLSSYSLHSKRLSPRYDREFLLQFMSICKEEPFLLTPLKVFHIDRSDLIRYLTSRSHSAHRSISAMDAPNPGQDLVISGAGTFGKADSFSASNFATPNTSRMLSRRLSMSNDNRIVSSITSGSVGMSFGRPWTMTHPPFHSSHDRERKRSDCSGGPQGQLESKNTTITNRWIASSARGQSQDTDADSPEFVDRKVKGLLNKLTVGNFDSISDQIISWVNKSEKEKDGRTMSRVINQVLECATDEEMWSEIYGRLCRKMMEQISPKVQDIGAKNANGQPIAGGQLFRKHLLNRCQEDFERGWVANDAAVAVAKIRENNAVTQSKDGHENGTDCDPVLYSDEYYVIQKAKRRGLCLIRFLGELFKLQMLTERIMHECIKKLLVNVENPQEDEIQSLCKLFTTIGLILDTTKARAHMDVYFSRIKQITHCQKIRPRLRFMLQVNAPRHARIYYPYSDTTDRFQDILELRDQRWVPRHTLRATKDRTAAEKVGPTAWAVAGGGSTGSPRPPPKAGDLSNFGKINKSAPMTFGPGNIFAGKKESKGGRPESLSRTASSSNMFSMLSQNPKMVAEAASKASRSPTRKASIDLGQSGVPESPAQRRKLNLLPRIKPTEQESTPALTDVSEEGEVEGTMSEENVKTRIDEDSKEFFAIRNPEDAASYFENLTAEHHFRLVDRLVAIAIESKEADAQLVRNFFNRAVSKELCSQASFEEGFLLNAAILDDIAIDPQNAFDLMAIMMEGANLDKECQARIAAKSMDSDKLVMKGLSEDQQIRIAAESLDNS